MTQREGQEARRTPTRSKGSWHHVRENLAHLRNHPFHLVVRDDVRRHKVDDVPERPKEKAAREKCGGEPRTDIVQITWLVRGQLHNSHTAEYANVADRRPGAERLEPCAQLLLEAADPCQQRAVREEIEAREADG